MSNSRWPRWGTWGVVAVLAIAGLAVLFYFAKESVRLTSVIVLAIILVIVIFYLVFITYNLVSDYKSEISKEIRSIGTFALGFQSPPLAVLR